MPAHRKWNRIDVGTADKVASAALGIADQARRLAIAYEETAFVLLELGGGFSAALAIDGGQIVDGLGGSAGPIGARACGALDGEAAYLIGGALSKRTVFSGGALDPDGTRDLAAPGALAALREDPAAADGWLAIEEGAAKAALALTASVRAHTRSWSSAASRRCPDCWTRSPGGSPTSRPSVPRRPPRARPAEPRCSRTGSRAGATRRWSSGCACARRVAARSTTCACTGPTGSCSADVLSAG